MKIVFAEVADDVRAELERYGLGEELGSDAFFARLADVPSLRG